MKKRLVQVLIIFICVSTFFIVKDMYFDSDNPFEKVEEGPDRISYINYGESHDEMVYIYSHGDENVDDREYIINYLKSLKYNELQGSEKNIYLTPQYGKEKYWLEFDRLIKTSEHSSELLTEDIILEYFEIEDAKYFVIKSEFQAIKSSSYEIISEFDNEKIKALLKPVE